eukprot:ctg_871.g219
MHAEDDKRRQAAVEAKNEADSLLYNTERTLNEHRSKVSTDDARAVESAISDLRAVLDKEPPAAVDEIHGKTRALQQAAMKVGEAIYRSAQSSQQQQQQQQQQQKASSETPEAEYKDVNEDDEEKKQHGDAYQVNGGGGGCRDALTDARHASPTPVAGTRNPSLHRFIHSGPEIRSSKGGGCAQSRIRRVGWAEATASQPLADATAKVDAQALSQPLEYTAADIIMRRSLSVMAVSSATAFVASAGFLYGASGNGHREHGPHRVWGLLQRTGAVAEPGDGAGARSTAERDAGTRSPLRDVAETGRRTECGSARRCRCRRGGAVRRVGDRRRRYRLGVCAGRRVAWSERGAGGTRRFRLGHLIAIDQVDPRRRALLGEGVLPCGSGAAAAGIRGVTRAGDYAAASAAPVATAADHSAVLQVVGGAVLLGRPESVRFSGVCGARQSVHEQVFVGERGASPVPDAMNDSRFNVTLAVTAALHGAVMANHTEVVSLIKRGGSPGRVVGAVHRNHRHAAPARGRDRIHLGRAARLPQHSGASQGRAERVERYSAASDGSALQRHAEHPARARHPRIRCRAGEHRRRQMDHVPQDGPGYRRPGDPGGRLGQSGAEQMHDRAGGAAGRTHVRPVVFRVSDAALRAAEVYREQGRQATVDQVGRGHCAASGAVIRRPGVQGL